MRPLILVIGILTMIYVISEWIQGHIQYSIEGYVGNGVYSMLNYAQPNFMPHVTFMDYVYALTFVAGLLMAWIGIAGGKK